MIDLIQWIAVGFLTVVVLALMLPAPILYVRSVLGSEAGKR